MFANLHFVSPDLARCAQPFTLRQWRAIHKHHRFAAIINLRGENATASWYQAEIDAARQVGCPHLDITLSSKRLPTQQSLLAVLDAFRDLPKPILIKCAGGADRTGLACALYLLDQQGPSALPQALGHLRLFPFLHAPKPYQRWIREFLHFYDATQDGQSLRDWMTSTYSPAAFAAYLVAQGKGDYWKQD